MNVKLPTQMAVAACALMTAGLFVTTTYADDTPAAPAAATAGAPMPGHDMHGQYGPGAHHPMRMEHFKASLHLNAQQDVLWKTATDAMKPPADWKARMKEHHAKVEAVFADPNFDPRKLDAIMEEGRAAHAAHQKQVHEAWFAFYDSLDAGQKGQVREFMRAQIEHPHRMHAGWGHGHMQHGPQDMQHDGNGATH
jgi:hypothetical protein